MTPAARRDLRARSLRQGAAVGLWAAWVATDLAFLLAIGIWFAFSAAISLVIMVARIAELQEEREAAERAAAAARAERQRQQAEQWARDRAAREKTRQAREQAERSRQEQEAAQSWRRVLGFTAGEEVTRVTIERRRRLLALTHHPDRGGSAEMMAEINRAADIGLQMVR